MQIFTTPAISYVKFLIHDPSVPVLESYRKRGILDVLHMLI